MELDRRTVLQASGIVVVGGVVAACGSSSSTASTSAAPASSAEASSAAPASSGAAPGGVSVPVSDVPVGGGVILGDQAVVITQPSQGDIKAFSAICTHQGCLVGSVTNNEIVCPCHGSKFSASDGAVLQGPAQTPLAASPITVEGGNVVLG